jgi:tripartite-type tricarboxylate transporter receptor subunit TctC
VERTAGACGPPPEAVSRINTLANGYLASDKGKTELAKFDMQSSGGTPEDLRAFMAAEVARWGPIIKAMNLSLE